MSPLAGEPPLLRKAVRAKSDGAAWRPVAVGRAEQNRVKAGGRTRHYLEAVLRSGEVGPQGGGGGRVHQWESGERSGPNAGLWWSHPAERGKNGGGENVK